MWRELLLLYPLAVLCNTAFPVPFDPVFIFFIADKNESTSLLFALIGVIGAGTAAVIDWHLAGAIAKKRIERTNAPLAYYAIIFGCAFLPLPFSVARAGLLKWRPRKALYACTVISGRIPRYLCLIYLGHTLPLSHAATLVLVIPICIYIAYQLFKKKEHSFEGRKGRRLITSSAPVLSILRPHLAQLASKFQQASEQGW